MAPSQTGKAGGSAAWGDMLASVLQTLEQALAKVNARENTLFSWPETSETSTWSQRLQAMPQRWQDLVRDDQLETQALAEAHTSFGAVEESLRQHLADIDALQQRLATLTGRAVG